MTEQLPQVSKLAGVLVEHQRLFEPLSNVDRQWVINNPKGAIALFNDAVRTRKQPIPPAKPAKEPLLVREGEPIKVVGAKRFVVAEKYRKGKTTDGVKIWNLGANFERVALPRTEDDVDPAELVTDGLKRNSLDGPITTVLGGDQKIFSVTLCGWFEYLKVADKSRWHFGYVDIDGVLWAVSSGWLVGRGWLVELYRVPYPYEWSVGVLVVSRKPLAA